MMKYVLLFSIAYLNIAAAFTDADTTRVWELNSQIMKDYPEDVRENALNALMAEINDNPMEIDTYVQIINQALRFHGYNYPSSRVTTRIVKALNQQMSLRQMNLMFYADSEGEVRTQAFIID